MRAFLTRRAGAEPAAGSTTPAATTGRGQVELDDVLMLFVEFFYDVGMISEGCLYEKEDGIIAIFLICRVHFRWLGDHFGAFWESFWSILEVWGISVDIWGTR